MSRPEPRWYEYDDCPDLGAPADDYLARLAELNDAYAAARRAREQAIAIDAAACEAWWDSDAATTTVATKGVRDGVE